MVINYSGAVASRVMILFVLLQAVLMHVMLMKVVVYMVNFQPGVW